MKIKLNLPWNHKMKWYKMDCDIQDNLDMRKLIDEWGWDWFGRYCAIIGKVGMLVTEKNQTFALQTNDGSPFPVKLLANDCSTTVERLSDFCKYLANNRLIDKDAWYDKNLIFIPKLRERADEYTKKLLTNSRHCPDQEVEEEKKKKKSTKIAGKVEIKDKYGDDVLLSLEEYGKLITRLGTKERADKCIEILDNAKGAKGYTYKSDYKAILTWVIKELEKRECNGTGARKPSNGSMAIVNATQEALKNKHYD